MKPTALTQMVDRVFAERYRIEELIGFGAISAVYSAYDSVEARSVALKVFDEALASDARFTERLLDAVEQAAVLVHPNIVEIYDWGVDDGPFIVSELCEGGSLAALLTEGHRLDASQGLVMALECARALNYGHEQGSIHRNLTPRNVLFSEDQRIRISDYGLARVLADAPVSQGARALENVRYASPEQARGRPVGEGSDLYSLALVVNEAVSGTPPRVAETVVGTLMDRAESPADLDAALGTMLLPLERCGRVEPDQRPEAEELAIALLAAAETMARPTVLPLVGIDRPADADQTTLLVAGGQQAPADETPASQIATDSDALLAAAADSAFNVDEGSTQTLDQALEIESPVDEGFDISALGELDDTDAFALDDVEVPPVDLALVVDESAVGGLENLEAAEPIFAAAPELSDENELDVPERAPTRRSAKPAYEELADDADDRLPWWPLVALVVAIAGLVAGGVYLFALDGSAESAVVPDVVGVQFDDLSERIADREWTVERLEDRIDGTEAGAIVAQSPAAGTELDEGGDLVVTVSLGNEMVEIPSDIIGLTVAQAETRLSAVGLALGRISEENSEALASGLVIGLDEPTTQKPTGDGVSLRVSAGAEDRVVPGSVIGLSIGDATSLLVGMRLQAIEELAWSPDAPVGTVLAAIPPAGSAVSADSAVTLLVSAGPEPVEMPDIIGLQLDEAIDVIEELGLIFVDTTGTPGEEVIGSLPPIGATTDVGTEVTIILNEPTDDE